MAILGFIGLDLALVCGISIISEDGSPVLVHTEKFKPSARLKHPGDRACEAYAYFSGLFGPLGQAVTKIAHERIIGGLKVKGRTVDNRVAQSLLTVVLMAASIYCRQAEIVPVAINSLKKFATGSGRANKDMMIAAAKQRWPQIAVHFDDNGADALWLAEYGRLNG